MKIRSDYRIGILGNGVRCVLPVDVCGVRLGYSLRCGGYSEGVYSSLNLGMNTADDIDRVNRNREKFFAEIAPKMLVAGCRQTHSSNIAEVDEGNLWVDDCDALYTTRKNILLTITTADCGSIMIFNRSRTFAAAIHSGWRGAKAGIIGKMLEKMLAYDKIENYVAVVGPMIQQASYEVGREFFDYFDAKYIKVCSDRCLLDLNGYIVDELINMGIGEVVNTGIDTYVNSEDFYSYRKSPQTGRMCGFVGFVEN